jgi:outer membrane protein assembly factor BamA
VLKTATDITRRSPLPARRTVCLVLLLAGAALLQPCLAQTPLYLIDNQTTVRSVDVAFDSTSTFDESQLLEHVATTGPSFFDRVKKILPFTRPASHPFNPLELLRDVVRLRQYYHNHGFLEPMITYRQSRLDTARNSIRVIFSIAEGPPVLIDSLFFIGIDGNDFPDSTMQSWRNFRREITIREGKRYSKPLQLQTREETLSWLAGSYMCNRRSNRHKL